MTVVVSRCKSLALSIILFSPLSFASNEQASFSQCQQRFEHQAQQQGYSQSIIDIIHGLSPIERVISLDKHQPEFAESFAQYVNKRVSDYHIKKGRELLNSHQQLLRQLQHKYQIPPQYLVAFWGLETVFGRHKGKMPTLDALATLACDQRRSDYFTEELFHLFELLEQGVVSADQLQGSWAGAMGHMQFMPSALKQYAIDGDQDGKIDVWQSEVDALTSAANYLQQIGWQGSERWGREVHLPENFDFSQIEFDKRYPLAMFAKMGVTQTNGAPLPNYQTKAELVLPNGHQGHAFLVYRNFSVIMDWNLSKNYALSVGILADKLVGGQGVSSVKQPKPLAYSKTQLEKLQTKLNALGFDTGEPDGIWGPMSRRAIRAFQLKQKLVADGFPNSEVFERLGLLQS